MTDRARETAREIAHAACPHSGVLQTPCCVCLDERIAAALTQQHAALSNAAENWKRDALRATDVATKYMEQHAALVGERETQRKAMEAAMTQCLDLIAGIEAGDLTYEEIAEEISQLGGSLGNALTPPPAERAQESGA